MEKSKEQRKREFNPTTSIEKEYVRWREEILSNPEWETKEVHHDCLRQWWCDEFESVLERDPQTLSTQLGVTLETGILVQRMLKIAYEQEPFGCSTFDQPTWDLVIRAGDELE